MGLKLRLIPLITVAISTCFVCTAAAQNLIISEVDRDRWQSVGRVNIGGFRSRGLCTGTLIAPDQVLTAAHCVVDPQTGVAFPLYRVTFVAGWHRGTHRGAGKARAIVVHPDYPTKTRRAKDRVSARDIAHDIAVITLQAPLSGVAPATVSQAAARPGPVAVLGYRKDRPEMLSDHLGCDVGAPRGTLLQVDCAIVEGTSGAPVWQNVDGTWAVIGVVSARNDNGGVAVMVTANSLADLVQ